ncbi:hypothetical protein [Fodinicola acaciae]|uniref:hypothetical protein n=1 Tax=Fodinicola acaciae TaxID=2681555 RepID=UPI0013D34C65|nr:hypothetical protein [Fodinicola acaciae]
MLTGEDYLDVVAIRAMRVRSPIFRTQIGPMRALVFTMADQGGLTRFEFCMVAAAFDEVNGFIVHDFTQRASAYARSHAAGVVGFTTTVVTLVCLASPVVRPDAIQVAMTEPRFQFAGETRPLVVDLTTGQRHLFLGSKAYGFAGLWTPAFQSTITGRADAVFPLPAVAEPELRANPRPEVPDAPQPPQYAPPPPQQVAPPPQQYAPPPPQPQYPPPPPPYPPR